jgi:integrase
MAANVAHMPRQIERLTRAKVSGATQRGLYADGAGLYLQVSRTGAKSWLYRFTFNGRRREMGLGPTHTVGLRAARRAAAECRRLRWEGADPIEHRRQKIRAARAEAGKRLTFAAAADTYVKTFGASWQDKKHVARWRSTLATYANPIIGALPVREIGTSAIMEVLEPIWFKKIETASRVRNRIEAVIDWSTARGYREGDNPARWRGHLEKLLPARTKLRQVVHRPALPYAELVPFLGQLQEQSAASAVALRFLILTATRTSETLGARWDEVDLDQATWTIPTARMKARREHRVPLSPAALKILHELKEHKRGSFVFSGAAGKPFSNMTLLALLKRMGRSDLTAHGFRSTFRDWAAEQTDFPREVAEMALAHAVSDKVEAAYRRGDLFEKRRRLMEAWATYSRLPGLMLNPARAGSRASTGSIQEELSAQRRLR